MGDPMPIPLNDADYRCVLLALNEGTECQAFKLKDDLATKHRGEITDADVQRLRKLREGLIQRFGELHDRLILTYGRREETRT